MKAWEKFLELGMPTKEKEAYRYVHLKELLSRPFHLCATSRIDVEPQENQLVFINGSYSETLSRPPQMLVALPLSKAFKTYGSFLNSRLQKLMREESDPFAALNGAYYQEGLFLYLPPKMSCDSPIRILHIVEGLSQPTLISPRIHLFVGKEGALRLSFSQTVSQDHIWINGYIDCALEERASVKLALLSEQLSESHDFLAVRATLKNRSCFRSCSATNGGTTSRHDYVIRLLGEEANASLYGVWAMEDHRQHHVHILMDHQEPSCSSLQKFKGVLNQSARSSFEGKIYVHPRAQKTEAYQMNHNLIMGGEATANCKPNLEIFADDVKASHGATIGQIDEEHLFYFKARGISAHRARSLIMRGFMQEMIDLFEDSELGEKALKMLIP